MKDRCTGRRSCRRLLLYESHQKLTRVRKRIKPLSKAYPSINLRGLITVCMLVSRALLIRSEAAVRFQLSYSSICAIRTKLLGANISRALRSIEIKPWHLPPYCTVRSRQREICPADGLFLSSKQWARGQTAWYFTITATREMFVYCALYISLFHLFRSIRVKHTPWRPSSAIVSWETVRELILFFLNIYIASINLWENYCDWLLSVRTQPTLLIYVEHQSTSIRRFSIWFSWFHVT